MISLDALNRAVGTFDAATGKPVDPYVAEAAKVFGVPEPQVTPAQRQYVKAQAHAALYPGVPHAFKFHTRS